MQITIDLFDYFTGEYFEQLIMEIYSYYGYVIETTKTVGDQGVDLIFTKDDEKIAVQCKRFSKKVTNKAIQEVFAGMHFYDCDKAIVITNSKYTTGAKVLADKLSVLLVGKTELNQLLNIEAIQNEFYKSKQLTQMLVNVGHNLMEHNRIEEAICHLKELLKFKEFFLEENLNDIKNAYNYLGLSYSELNADFKSIECYREGLLVVGNNRTLLNNLAVSYRSLEQFEEAKESLEHIIDADGFYKDHIKSFISQTEYLIKLKKEALTDKEKAKEYEAIKIKKFILY